MRFGSGPSVEPTVRPSASIKLIRTSASSAIAFSSTSSLSRSGVGDFASSRATNCITESSRRMVRVACSANTAAEVYSSRKLSAIASDRALPMRTATATQTAAMSARPNAKINRVSREFFSGHSNFESSPERRTVNRTQPIIHVLTSSAASAAGRASFHHRGAASQPRTRTQRGPSAGPVRPHAPSRRVHLGVRREPRPPRFGPLPHPRPRP